MNWSSIFRKVSTSLSSRRKHPGGSLALSFEPLETKLLLAFTAPQVIIADQDTGLTSASDAPGFRAVMIQETTDKVVAAGSFEGSHGDDFTLVRYTPDGQLDTSFGASGVVQTNFSLGKPNRINDDTLWGAAMDSNGRIVASGHDRSGNLIVARYTANGVLDNSFSGDGFDVPDGSAQLDQSMHTIAFDASNNVYVAGAFNDQFRVVKYTSSGTLDASFDNGGVASIGVLDGIVSSGAGSNNRPVSVAIDDNGHVILVGSVESVAYENRFSAIIRLTSQGNLDIEFLGNLSPDLPTVLPGIVLTDIHYTDSNGVEHETMNNYGNGLVIDSNGKLVISGFATYGVIAARYDTDGKLDTTFNPDGVVSGIPGKITPGIAIAEAELHLDTGVGRGRDVAIDNQDRVVVGGIFDHGIPNNSIGLPPLPPDPSFDTFLVARFEPDGDLDNTFATRGVWEKRIGNGWNELTEITVARNGDIWASGLACASNNGCDQYGNGESFHSVLLRFAAPTPKITVSPASIQTSEDGDTDQFSVVLDTQPTVPVLLDITSSLESEGAVVGATDGVLTLAFDATNWDVPQAVTVQGIDDAALDDDQTYQIEIVVSPSSSDPDYANLGLTTVAAINLDNDQPPPVALYVQDIYFESKRGGKDWRAVFVIYADANGNGQIDAGDVPVAGVGIEVDFDGLTSGTTDSNGVFRSSWKKDLPSGNYYANVVDLALAGYAWNPLDLLNLDDSDGDGKPDDLLSL